MNFESLPVAHCCPCLSVAAARRPSLCSGAEGRLLHEHFGLAQHGFAQSFGTVCGQVLYLSIQWPARKNKQSALWLALYRLLWCMLFRGVSELLVVQCLGCGTDLPLVATPSSALDRFAFGHGCLMGILATYCIWALWQSQQPHLGYQLGLRGPSGYRSLRTQERCPGLRCCLTSGYGNQLHAGACRAGTRDGHARVLPSPVPLIFPAGFYF